MKQIISTSQAPAAIGPYSQAIMAGGFLYASGQIPIVPQSGVIEATDIQGQTHQVMRNMGAILSAAGMDYSHVIKTTVFIADMADFAVVNEVYAQYFKEQAPARSCVAVKSLPKGALIEIEMVAYKG
ncbi:MAG: RidA family protein [Paludibacteraceae bacterium]|nr:RidA family protein [Paludibacteraceae bacterium]